LWDPGAVERKSAIVLSTQAQRGAVRRTGAAVAESARKSFESIPMETCSWAICKV